MPVSRKILPRPPFERKLADAYRRLGAIGQRLLLAVSGGADSTALLLGSSRLQTELRLTLEVASLDHGLRAASRSELEQVRKLSARLGLAFHRRALSIEPGASLEERARQARYAALEEIRTARGLDLIATAHTASDQAETLLMRLARGAALRGAAGILEKRARIVRPLLACSRAEVEAFLAGEGVDFARDPMNVDPTFLRSRIRAQVIPALEAAAGPGAIQRLARFAATAGEDAALLDGLADQAFERLRLGNGHLDATGVRALALPMQRRALARLIGEAGGRVDLLTLDRAMAALQAGRAATLSGGLSLRTAGGTVRCVPATRRAAVCVERALGDAWLADPLSGLRIRLTQSRPRARECRWLGLGEVALPLSLRRRRPGDRVGARIGRAKLQDLMVDLKVPAEQRDLIPVICDAAGNIVWVVGVWPRRGSASGRWYVVAEPISKSASGDGAGTL